MKTPAISLSAENPILKTLNVSSQKLHTYLRYDGLNSQIPVHAKKLHKASELYFSPSNPIRKAAKPVNAGQVIDFRFG